MLKKYLVKEIRIGYKTIVGNTKKEAIENALWSEELSEKYFDDVGWVIDSTGKEHKAFLDIKHKAYVVKSIE